MPNLPKTHQSYAREILAHIDASEQVTQRDLASAAGIALSLTNLLIRQLVKKGWIQMVRVKPNRFRYLLTPAGMAAKARQTREYLEGTVRLYTETRELMRRVLERLSDEWPCTNGGSAAGLRKRIVFYGAGEVAEIGYVSLQATDLELVGVIDDNSGRRFFGMAVHAPSALTVQRLNGESFEYLVIMSFKYADRMRLRMERRGFPRERIICL